VLLKKSEVVGDTDQRPAVAGERHHGKRSEDGVDSAALVAELAGSCG
jgi:hypothetical protein